jgi:prepilin-type N-terminal cleavage/methylation domain-containing protein
MSARRRSLTSSLARPRARFEGFTLIELMIVVVIVSGLAGLFAPSVRRTVLEQRGGSAAREVVKFFREARIQTMSDRRARAVYVNPAASSIRILPGTNGSCLVPNWSDVNTSCTSALEGSPLLTQTAACQSLRLDREPWSILGSNTIELREIDKDSAAVSTERLICFAPNGGVWHQSGALSSGSLTDENSVEGGFLFQLAMVRAGQSSSPELLKRQVLVPLNGLARLLR